MKANGAVKIANMIFGTELEKIFQKQSSRKGDLVMWKLSIKQNKECNHIEGTYDVEVELTSEDLSEITMLIERLSHMGCVGETSYKIERVKESEA